MPKGKAQKLYNTAIKHWPSINWPIKAFTAHLNSESPAHPDDLYLAGAAGHRLDSAWLVIDSDIAPAARRVLQRQPIADFTVEDLWSESLLRQIADDPDQPPLPDGRQPAKIIRYRARVPLLNYFIVAAKRLAISRKRQLETRNTHSMHLDTDEGRPIAYKDSAAPDPAAQSAQSEIAAAMQQALAAAMEKLSDEQRFVIAMVYCQDMKRKDAGVLVGWSEFKTSRQLKAAMQTLQSALSDLPGLEWTPEIAAAWETAWAEHWKNVQVPEAHASDSTTLRKGADV